MELLEDRLVLSVSPLPSAASLLNAGPVPFASAFASAPAPAEDAGLFVPVAAGAASPAPTAASGTYFPGDYYDVNKYHSGTDSQLCWAAALANVLAYTNWGYSTAVSGETPDRWLFSDEYEIYDYFIDNFTNKGGHAYYAFPWFADGTYAVQGSSSWSQVTGDGGYLYPGISIPDVRIYLHCTDEKDAIFSKMTGYLEKGYGVVLALGWYTADSPTRRTGGHSVTVWGYTYNPELDPADPSYYTGLIVTNSDDSVTGTKTIKVEWNGDYDMYRLSDYSGGRGWIEDFVCIKPVETLTGVAAAGFSGPYDGLEHTVTVSGIDISGADEYTVIYNHDGGFTLKPPAYTVPGTHKVVVVAVKNEFDAIWSAPVTVTITGEGQNQLGAPTVQSVNSAGLNRQTVAWSGIAEAVGYEISWSEDSGMTWRSLTTDRTELTITGLTYGKTARYTVRALGDGENLLTSVWSAETTLPVNPVDLDKDGFIGPGDYSLLSAAWFSSPASENWDPRFDIDGDGFIGPGDFTYLSADWLKKTDSGDFKYPTA